MKTGVFYCDKMIIDTQAEWNFPKFERSVVAETNDAACDRFLDYDTELKCEGYRPDAKHSDFISYKSPKGERRIYVHCYYAFAADVAPEWAYIISENVWSFV